MGRRKNTFSRALGQLKSTSIDEKLEVLQERPTNSTVGINDPVAGTLTRTDSIPSGTEADHSTIDWDVDGGDGKDISALSLNWKRFLKNTVFLNFSIIYIL